MEEVSCSPYRNDLAKNEISEMSASRAISAWENKFYANPHSMLIDVGRKFSALYGILESVVS